MDKLLIVKNLRTYFKTFKGLVKSVDGVDFSLERGETLGIVGESGGGKSVTGFSIIKLIEEPGEIVNGQIIFEGEDLVNKSEKQMEKIRGKEISMIFQDPMTALNPILSIRKQIDEALQLHTTLGKGERLKTSIELLRSVGIPNPEVRIESFPHELSGGMRQRVIIAIAIATNPKLIIADEPTTALDVTIQAQILKLMKEVIIKNNNSLILITHNLAVVSQMTDKVMVMYCGKVMEQADTETIIHSSSHPYTRGLLSSIPRFRSNHKKLDTIEGIVPNMYNLPKGCYFAPRCKYRRSICETEQPSMRETSKGHFVYCHFPLTDGDN
ncbi:MAG: ABC transporter ATP-binding protein [Acetomicrobium flavidum]|uniref:ABC transporter ATP-binding protein n=1 Tax=Acetomicrobium flavidum TaxID=49896 RepID=UPI0016B15AB7|nr:ABC transporter ATP-binding protein [Acetomicrobium flavidum]